MLANSEDDNEMMIFDHRYHHHYDIKQYVYHH